MAEVVLMTLVNITANANVTLHKIVDRLADFYEGFLNSGITEAARLNWDKVGEYKTVTIVILMLVFLFMMRSAILSCLGFTKKGPRADSIASKCMRSCYKDGVPKGSMFSYLQSNTMR